MRKISFFRQLGGILGLALGTMVSLGSISIYSMNRITETNKWVSHTKEVQASLESVFRIMLEAESAQRGYLITKKPVYLEPYANSAQSIDPELEKLKELTKDNPSQSQRIQEIETLILERFDRLRDSQERTESLGFDAVIENARDGAQQVPGEGEKITQTIRVLIEEAQQEELELLAARRETNRVFVQFGYLSVGGLIFFGFFIIGSAAILIKSSWDKQHELEDQLRYQLISSSQDLETHIATFEEREKINAILERMIEAATTTGETDY